MARRPTGKITNSILENLSDAVVAIDREGKILIFNPEAEKLFGLEQKDILKKKIWDVMEINDFTRTIISMIKESEPSTLEQVFPFPDNRIFLAKMYPVYNTDNRIIGAVAILEDLTSIHNMEKTINEFVTMVSHELKTPLTSIKGFVETLLEGALSNPQVTRRFLQVINDETNRMTRLVVGLLDLTRAIRENPEIETLKPINTSKLIQSVTGLFGHIAEEKGIKLIISVPDDLPSLQANEDKIRQVIINLVDNAIKYTSIKKAQNEVEVQAEAQDEQVIIKVRDTGVGIPGDEIKNIFKKFYRVTTGPSAELGGTGLGLSITREIVTSYGGTIEVKSAQGEHTIFTIKLPINPREDIN